MKINATLLTLALSLNLAFAGPWCGYSEFVHDPNPSLKDQLGVIRVRALQCQGQPGNVTLNNSDGTPCNPANAKVGNNLVKIANLICKDDPSSLQCMAAYQSFMVQNPETLRKNAAFHTIFECD
jgi:hypothetical protein